MKITQVMKNPFRQVRIEPEAYHAYLDRLPDSVQVTWRKEGDTIVGEVALEELSFGVQAKAAKEFIDLVNEGILVAYDTPEDYIEPLMQVVNFVPTSEEFKALKQRTSGVSNLVIQAEENPLVA